MKLMVTRYLKDTLIANAGSVESIMSCISFELFKKHVKDM